MFKRKYTHIQLLLQEIQAMLAAGKSHREIEEHFGLTGVRPVHNLLKRERGREKKCSDEIATNPKGRPRKDGKPPIQNEKKELDQIRNVVVEELLLDGIRKVTAF